MTTLGIGQLAGRAGVAIDAVRYYERNQRRPDGSHRATAATARANSSDCASSGGPRGKVRRAAERKLAGIEQRVGELQRIRRGLRSSAPTGTATRHDQAWWFLYASCR